jgi:hypothetical protein
VLQDFIANSFFLRLGPGFEHPCSPDGGVFAGPSTGPLHITTSASGAIKIQDMSIGRRVQSAPPPPPMPQSTCRCVDFCGALYTCALPWRRVDVSVVKFYGFRCRRTQPASRRCRRSLRCRDSTVGSSAVLSAPSS